MKTVNISSLKNNPSEALRYAHEDMVLVMNRDQPDALMIGLNQTGGMLDMPGVRTALATSLFKGGVLSLARSARLANMVLALCQCQSDPLVLGFFQRHAFCTVAGH